MCFSSCACLVVEAYEAATSSMARLNRTGAQLMHKYGRLSWYMHKYICFL